MSNISSEKYIERKLVTEVKKLGWLPIKFKSVNFSGLPDRILLKFPRQIVFVELKSTGKPPTRLQLLRIWTLKLMGFPVFVVDSLETLENFLKYLKNLDESRNSGKVRA